MRKSRFIAAALLACGALLGTAAQAVTASVYVQVAPPAPRYEAMPVARAGHVWVPGHWQWQGYAHVWVDGHWVRERPGYAYHQPRWERYGDRWGYTPGVWVQAQYGYDRHWDQYRRADHRRRAPDRDRDGIPDWRDHDLDNDGRRNNRDWDADGDGVRNRYDRDPYDRYRR